MKYFKLEIKKLQENYTKSQDQVKCYEETVVNLQVQLRNNEEKNKQLLDELSYKEEQIVVHKVEIQAYNEKLKARNEEVYKQFNFLF